MGMTDSMGNLIRATFTRSGMSIKRLSRLAGIGYATAHAFVRDSIDPTLTTVERICKALDLELRPVRRGKQKGR